MTTVTATAMKTVLDFGADATGKADSSQAFNDAAAHSDIATVIVPSGDYVIAKTVDLQYKNLSGPGRLRENQKGRCARIRPASGLSGPMFINQGPLVENLLIQGQKESDSKIAFDAYGYNSVFKNIHFTNIQYAIYVKDILVNFTMEDCVCIQVGYGLYCEDSKNSYSTTARFLRNEFNNCGNAFIFRRQINGSTFQDNIFEFLSGDAVAASHIYDCNFIGNWWEKRRDTGTAAEVPLIAPTDETDDESGYPAIRSTSYQQIMNCFAAGNKVTWGWRNVFSSLLHDARMGGVSAQGGAMVVRSASGRAMRITPDSIVQQADKWAYLPPLVIEACKNSAGSAKGIVMRTKGGPLTLEDSEDQAFSDAITIGKGDGLYERYSLTRNAAGKPTVGLTGVSEMMINGEKVKLTTGIPQHFLWRQDKLSRGLGCFTTNQVTTEGTIKLVTEYLLDNPLIQVTVEDRGVRFDGLKHLNSYINSSKTRRQCTGFELYFVDADGKPKTPTAFSMQMLTLNPSLLTS
ncbi:glycosyl hydrolase family 28-related protein [Kushneria marisflavi]|uniref:Rhamnogalacturonase A/B/Epimerase-like pectate lyase domain-containing protein n=1 Tax=Kushneria marisflavi TaxID=157779 RepID=A0A240UKU9_9GAMM|nr:glycosyl hydrolase family 28-related protein [Kushneria marisflavi]ART62124.1 hypothetical protein B9H00_02735 [Kushneria marisflavi]RKD87200.1 pectate lyase-like protein [Kushneria marisflavi]